MQGVAVVRFTLELSKWDPETFLRNVLVDWLHVVEVWVGANFLFGHERAGHVFRAQDARRSLRLSRGKNRSGPLQGLRREQHPDSSSCRGGTSGRGGGPAWSPLLHRRDRDPGRRTWARAGLSNREPGDLQRARPADRRLCHDGHDRWRRPSVDYEYRHAAHLRGCRSPDRRNPSFRISTSRPSVCHSPSGAR